MSPVDPSPAIGIEELDSLDILPPNKPPLLAKPYGSYALMGF